MRELPEFSLSGGRTSVSMRFEPYQSFFVVFRSAAPGTKSAGRNFPEMNDAGEIAGPWEVSFDPNRGGPEKAVFDQLEDWTHRSEPGIKYYSGAAVYRLSFDLPETSGRLAAPPMENGNSAGAPAAGEKPGDGDQSTRWWVDLGIVKNMADVRLNGRDLGVVWCAPWRVDITGAVKAKGNRLEITVANLWPNRLIGDEQLPPDCEYGKEGNLLRWPDWFLKGEPRPSPGRLTFSTWKHFTKDSPLLPSGLLGPVTLRIEQAGT